MTLERRSGRSFEKFAESGGNARMPGEGFDRMTPIGAAWAALAKSARVDKCNREIATVS